MLKEHRLKCWPSMFEPVLDGRKTFETRLNDRDFAVGDIVVLEEWDPAPSRSFPTACIGYTGRTLRLGPITFLLQGCFGLPSSVCVFSWTKAAMREESRPPSEWSNA